MPTSLCLAALGCGCLRTHTSSLMMDVCWRVRGVMRRSFYLKFNPLVVYLFRDNLLNVHRVRHPGKPLRGLRILDVGCGGGLLTEVSGCLLWERCRSSLNKDMQTKIAFAPIPPLSIPNSFSCYLSRHIEFFSLQIAVCFSVRFCSQCIIVPVLSHTYQCPTKHLNVSLILLPFWFDWSQCGGADSRSFKLVYLFVSVESWAARTGLLSLPLFDRRTYKTKSGPVLVWLCHTGCHI